MPYPAITKNFKTLFKSRLTAVTKRVLGLAKGITPQASKWSTAGWHIRMWGFVVLLTLTGAMNVFLEATVVAAMWLLGGSNRRIRISDLVKYLPRVSEEQMGKPGVYRIIGRDRKINSWDLYVGMSGNLGKRWRAHITGIIALVFGVEKKPGLTAYQLLFKRP